MINAEILDVQSIRLSESLTMAEEPISSIDLMERAGTCFAEHLMRHLPLDRFEEIIVCCGPGNNGGDGLVIARLLQQQRWNVCVILAAGPESKTTPEFDTNLQRWYELNATNREQFTIHCSNAKDLKISPRALVIDAIFGIGISKPLQGHYAEIVQAINTSGAYIVAVDAPSGMRIDCHTEAKDLSILAEETYTFQFPKIGFLLPENHRRCGEVSILDIGLRLPDTAVSMQLLEAKTIRHLLHAPQKFAHKGQMGHGLLIAGSADMPGAAILAATAALRGGIGKVTVHSVSKVCDLLPASIPEAILSRDRNEQCFSRIDLEKHPSINVIAIGCGLGTSHTAAQGLKMILDEVQSPLILDADALNILGTQRTWLGFLPAQSILTPHFKEFERLVGPCANDFDRIEKLRKFAQKQGVIVILKGAHTAVALPDGKIFFNTTGNPGMATAGSGDTLTGLLLALMAQGYAPAAAALIGVYLHGAAGDAAVDQLGHPSCLIASDIPRFFGKALENLI